MSEHTTIQWCDFTFNGWEGCTKLSPGCTHCYAEARNHRFGADNWGKGKPRRRTSEANWKLPLKWNAGVGCKCGEPGLALHDCEFGRYDINYRSKIKRPRVFCASLADWLDDEVPIEWLADLLALIHATPNLDWLLLTKRPENFLRRMLAMRACREASGNEAGCVFAMEWRGGNRPQNVWIGVSVEDQQRADERIPALLKIPARVRFLSVEPMLEAIDLDANRGSDNGRGLCWDWTGRPTHVPHCDYGALSKVAPNGPSIHWAIFGGESGGKDARPCNVEWIRDGVSQCRAAGVAPFCKQLGSAWARKHESSDKKGGQMSDWPTDLRIREFPNVRPN